MDDGIYLCGAFSVILGGRALERELPGRQGRLLVAYLAAHHPEPVSRDDLLGVLWPEGASPRSARDALNVVLSKVKRTLGTGGAALAGRDQVVLRLPPGVLIDVHEIQRLVAVADRAASPAEAGEAAHAALTIVERGLLPGLDGNWIEELRLELEELRLRALEYAAGAGLASGGTALAEAQRCARTLIAAAPYRESGYRLLMELLARHGDVAEALRVYDDLRVLLRHELGVAPGPAVKALHQQLLELSDRPAPSAAARDSGTPALGAAGLPFPPVLARLAPSRFVGRARLLERLEQAWEKGEPRLLVIGGEPGVGKTSLAARFAQDRHAQGALVLHGRCEEDGLAPYAPVAEALGPLTGASASRPELTEIVGALEPAPDAERLRLFTAVEDVVAAAAEQRPVLLVLDDLQWVDRPTLALLRHLSRAAIGGRLLLLGTFRDVEATTGHPLRTLIVDLRREGLADTVALEGLAEEEVAELVETLVPAAVDPASVRRLHAGTEGNPLFIRELVRAAGENVEAAFERVPPGVHEAIERRLVPLPAPVTRCLAVAAVAGREFELRLLEKVPELASEDVLNALEAATEARLLTEVPERPGRFLFSHALVRDALYQRLSATRRARLHLQLADALEGDGGRPAEVAHHVLQASAVVPPERVVAVLRRAGEHARRQLAYEEAAAHFEAALDAAEDELERCDLALAAGEAHQRAGERPEARELFRLAVELARERDPGRLVRAALGVRGPYIDSGVVDEEAVALLEEAVEACGTGWVDLRTIAQARLAQALYWTGDRERIDRLSAEAVDFARRLEDSAVLVAALEARHEVLRVPWGLDERREVVEHFLDRAEVLGDRELAVQAHQLRAVDAIEAGDVELWEREVRAVRRLAGDLRQPLWERYVLMWDHMRAQLDGRLDDAERLAHEALGAAVRAGAQDGPQAFGAQMFNILSYRGSIASMRPMVEAIVHQYPGLPVWKAGLARIYAELGESRRARDLVDGLADNRFAPVAPDFFWLPAMMLLADTVTIVGDETHAATLLECLEPFAAHQVLARGATCFGPLARSLGGLAGVLADGDRAERHFEHAVELCRRLRAPLLEAQTRVDQVAARLRAGGDGAETGALLAGAMATCRALGAHGLTERAQRLAATGALDAPGPPVRAREGSPS